MESIGGAKKSK